MKNIRKSLLVILVAAVLAVNFTACGKTTENTGTSQTNGLWENATYQEDTEFGKGEKTVVVEVKAGEQTVKFTIHTDEKTVGAALIANNLIAGDEGEFGIYIKVVNGITADYDVNQSYWAFYIDGEYAMSGVDSTEITEGVTYKLEYTR